MDSSIDALFACIVDDDRERARALLEVNAGLAMRGVGEGRFYDERIFHWIYAGDTALHLAAAGYRVEIVELLIAAGAEVNAAKNHRRSRPLHYAADGYINGPAWDAKRQVKTIHQLLEAGADIHAQDKNGAAALHRAVRTRCAAAVAVLLTAGSDPTQKNKSGSTAFHLAVQNTGRGGSGAQEAKAAHRQIIVAFLATGAGTGVKDGKGKSVLECATSGWIRDMLA